MQFLPSLRLYTLIISAAALAFIPRATHAADKSPSGRVSLTRITPEGQDVPAPTQIVFQFNSPVVPLGRMERSPSEIAIAISPPLACQWRWMNTSALACVLDQKDAAKNATSYTITVPTTFDKTRGEVLPAAVTHSFITQRPSVTDAWVTTWNSPTAPVLSLIVNQKVTKETLAEHLVLEDGNKASLPVVVATETPDPENPLSPEVVAERLGKYFVVSPAQDLPADTQFTLRARPGLVPLEGNEVGAEQRAITSFSTFPSPEFLGLSCYDLKGETITIPAHQVAGSKTTASKRCDPLNAIQLRFNAPVLKEQLSAAIVSSPDLRGGRTDFDPWEDVRSY